MTFHIGDHVKRVRNLIWDELDSETVYEVIGHNVEGAGEIKIIGGSAWSDFWYESENFELVPPVFKQETGTPKSVDMVNQPPHYQFEDGVEVIDLTEQLNFNCGNAVKYIARAGRKDPAKAIEDLEKAEFYVKRELERVKRRGSV